MARPPTIMDRILQGVRLAPDCRLDDLVMNCRDFTWQEVFLEINRLYRAGELELTFQGLGACTMRLAERGSGSLVKTFEGSGSVNYGGCDGTR
jgi:hypothetical protein